MPLHLPSDINIPQWVQQCHQCIAYMGGRLASPLTAQKFRLIEKNLGIKFPEAFRTLLSHSVPFGEFFPDWHAMVYPNRAKQFKKKIAEDLSDSVFSTMIGTYPILDFWTSEACRLKKEELLRLLKNAKTRIQFNQIHALIHELLAKEPLFLPVYMRRYTSVYPSSFGKSHSVYSVRGSDVIFYGQDLLNFFIKESHIFDNEDRPQESHLKEALFSPLPYQTPKPFMDAYDQMVFLNEKNYFHIALNATGNAEFFNSNGEHQGAHVIYTTPNAIWFSDEMKLKFILPPYIQSLKDAVYYLKYKDFGIKSIKEQNALSTSQRMALNGKSNHKEISIQLLLKSLHFQKQAILSHINSVYKKDFVAKKSMTLQLSYLQDDWLECTFTELDGLQVNYAIQYEMFEDDTYLREYRDFLSQPSQSLQT